MTEPKPNARPAKKKITITALRRPAFAEPGWAIALRPCEFGYADIATGRAISDAIAIFIISGWLAKGAVISKDARSGKGRNLFAVRADFQPGIQPRQRKPEDYLWTAMHGLRSFAPLDLAAHATTATVTVPVEKASEYCRFLLAAGYLRVVRPAQPAAKREATCGPPPKGRMTRLAVIPVPLLAVDRRPCGPALAASAGHINDWPLKVVVTPVEIHIAFADRDRPACVLDLNAMIKAAVPEIEAKLGIRPRFNR